ncbi:MAG: replicative DNA helicase [Candidatus Harrisonbacteria bacterium]|nr:replicative DNA helicase [Candidatus Harrisonbacteria bacterium]
MSQVLKLPPQHLEAEQSVLGALMIDKDAMTSIADVLRPDDFYKPAHAKIYEAMLGLYEHREPIDMLSVTTRLKESGAFKDAGGASYLSELMAGVPSASHVTHYAKLVREKRVLRDLITASAEIAETAFDPGEDVEAMIDGIEQKIFSIAQRSTTQKFLSLKDQLTSAYERIEKIHAGKGALRGLSTGFQGIDSYLSGLQKSDLIVIGARPSLGKTSLALDIARHVGVKEKKTVAIFSLEMAIDQVIDRFIAAEARVPLWHLRTGRLSSDVDFQLIQTALNTFSDARIFIDDTGSPNILQMRSVARRLQAEHGLDLVVVDYLQLMTPRTKTDSVVAQVTEISRGLKTLARELNVPVLALSQLSRGVEQREDKTPRLADLRESGSIEQDADVVMLIHRKDKQRANPEPQDLNMAELIIAKHRNGPIGSVKLRFNPDAVSFETIDNQHNGEYA